MTGPASLTLAVLGDSIAYGQGATHTADSIGPRLAAALTANGTRTDVVVLAVPGARSSALAAQVRAAHTAGPQLALIVIGANDLTHLVPVDEAADQLARAVRALRERQIDVVVAPAPDLSAVPWIPPQFRAFARSTSAALRAAQTRAALAEGARVAHVEKATAAFAADPSLFSPDRFHPSSKGYAHITRALLPAVAAAANDAALRRDRQGP